MTERELIRKWYEKGREAGRTEGWMNLEETLEENYEEAIRRGESIDVDDLVMTGIEERLMRLKNMCML